MESPLSNLLVKGSKKIEEIMYSILKDYIQLDEESKEVIFLESAKDLSVEKRILLLLMGYKAMEILNLISDSSLSPQEIAKKIGANYNTVRSKLSKLAREGLVNKVRKGRYAVQLSKIIELSELFKK